LQRTFKAATGVTPKQYVDAARMKRLKEGLKRAKDVTEAVYEAGYGSASRVYERADTRLGMTPRQYREGGRGVEITWAAVDSRQRGTGRLSLGPGTQARVAGFGKKERLSQGS